MNVVYSDAAKSDEAYPLLQKTTARLEEVLGRSVNLVKAEWDREADSKGQAVYTLRLSEWAGTVSASFTPDELQSNNHLLIRLYRLWGELLKIRSHKQLQEMGLSGE